jgi:hypothetical protein
LMADSFTGKGVSNIESGREKRRSFRCGEEIFPCGCPLTNESK